MSIHTLPRRLLLLALLALPLAGARAEEERPASEGPRTQRLPLPEPMPVGPRWYGLYFDGTKSGWIMETFERRGEGAEAAWHQRTEMRLQILAMGQKLETTMLQDAVFDVEAPYALRAAKTVRSQGPVRQAVVVERTPGGYAAVITESGRSRRRVLDAVDATLEDLLSPVTWIRRKPEVGARLSLASFDASDLEEDVKTYTVTSAKETVVSGVRTQVYEVTGHSEREGDEGTMILDADGLLLSLTMGDYLEARLEPEDLARKIEYSADLFIAGTVPLDKPLGGDATRARRLVMEAVGEGAAELESAPRQTVVRDAGTTVISLGASAANADPATPEEIADALRETVDYPIRQPEVVALATQAVQGATTPREQAARLVKFVSDFLVDAILPHECSVAEMLEGKKGDCSEHARLFTTLARALGLPAREVSGLMYMGDEIKAFGGHAWNEVALDGHWEQVDPAWNQLEVDATHVTLSQGSKDGLKQAKTFGRLQFRLREVELAPAPPKAEPKPEPAGAR